jgi:hypothetical protein
MKRNIIYLSFAAFMLTATGCTGANSNSKCKFTKAFRKSIL